MQRSVPQADTLCTKQTGMALLLKCDVKAWDLTCCDGVGMLGDLISFD